MSIRVTHVRLSNGGYTSEHITNLKWIGYENGKVGDSTKAELVEWIDGESGEAYVETQATKVSVGVVKPDGGPPYLRTYANGVWTDNLLSLPRF